MNGNEFKKTPEQLKEELERGIERLHRQLLTSEANTKDGHSNLLRAVLILFLLCGNLLFSFWFEGKNAAAPSSGSAVASPTSQGISAKELGILETQLARVIAEVDAIQEVRSRAAPNLPISGNLGTIRDAIDVQRNILGISRQTATSAGSIPASAPTRASGASAPN